MSSMENHLSIPSSPQHESMSKSANRDKIKALAHITGGGIVENLPRVLPEGMRAKINKEAIRILPIFEFMAQHVEEEEMFRTFNMGVGMVLVVESTDAQAVCDATDGYIIGEIIQGEKGVDLI